MDEFAEKVCRTNPAPALDPEILESSLLMARAVAMTPVAAPPAPRRRLKRRIAAVVSALVVIPTTAVATGTFVARTGQHRPASTENDTSEVINVCAPDFPAYVKALPRPKDAPPAGMTWSQIADQVSSEWVQSSCRHGEKEVDAFETAFKGDFYFKAGDIYVCRAVAKHDANDESAARQQARLYATTLERIDRLGLWGDDRWKSDHAAALNGDWGTLRRQTQPASAGGAEPCQ